MKDKKDKKSKNIFYWIIIILLIISILLLSSCNRLGKIDNCCLKPTGNVDIFDIDINKICENDSKSKDIYPVWNPTNEDNELGKIYVDDLNGNYIYQQKLNIFNNPFYEYDSKIAPGVSNSYSFVVHNDSNDDVNYYIEMYEKCDYDVDLQYRLRKNGEYVIGNDDKWVSADELKTAFSKLNNNNNDNYILDWKWEYESGHDDIDTYIGENMDSTYQLNIKFYFEKD